MSAEPPAKMFHADWPEAEPVRQLPPPVSRQPLHTRTIVCHSFMREDQLCDIEARVVDTKAYAFVEPWRGERQIGDPVHEMAVRLTIGLDMVVREVHVSMPAAPYPICARAQTRFDGLIGAKIGNGWRREVRERVGVVEGCTHVRELLYPMATVAYQTLSGWSIRQARGLRYMPPPNSANATSRPHFIDGCLGWAADGEVVARLYPQFAEKRREDGSS